MSYRVIVHCVLLATFSEVCVGWAAAQTATAPPPASKRTCPVDQSAPTEADRALQQRKYTEAKRLYGEALAENPASDVAMAGLVRTTLAEDKLPEALALAMQDNAARPNDTILLDALGEVRFRRGEVDEAAIAWNQAVQLDSCNGVTLYDMSRFWNLSGMHGKAQRFLEMAHKLSPQNKEIDRRWLATHATPMTPEQQLAFLTERLSKPDLPPEQKEGMEQAIKGIETREKGDCELVSPVTAAKFPIVPIANGVVQPGEMQEAGLEVQFNGKKKRLEIDTGASGLMLSRSAAKSAGLVPELEIKAGGIGDQGLASAYVTHVDDIRIGSMEFKNCMVRVLEQNSALEIDGLIGPDVFRDYLVTLDFPSREVRIGPLPNRPDDTSSKPASLRTSDDDASTVSIADSAKDRYIAPEMKDWTPVFRSDHFLIVPTFIGNAPLKLFIMDSGAMLGMITPAAAREVTHVSGNPDLIVRGINGQVKNVLIADKVQITFARVSQITEGMTAYDSSLLAHTSGVEISGLIGFPTLRELVLSVDYRDNLVHVVYDSKKGFHGR